MSIKITIPNSSSDVLTFGSGNTPTAAQIAGIDSGSSNGQLALYTTASGTSTEAMRINSSQNVGIGTSSPAFIYTDDTTFTVNGKQAATSYRSAIELGNNGSLGAFYFCSTANAVLGSYANIPLAFRTNNTERMRIDSSGNLLVGSTSGSPDSFGEKLFVSQSGANSAFVGSNTNASCTSAAIIGVTADRNTTNNSFYAISYYNRGSATYKFRVADSGNVTNTNNSYGPISDVKLKENIVDATPKLEKLLQVRIVNYNLKADLGYESHKQIGVIAQELEQVFPSLVDDSVDRDEEGNDLGTTTKSVKMSVFVPMLIKAIQEQQAIIQTLTDRITALEGATS